LIITVAKIGQTHQNQNYKALGPAIAKLNQHPIKGNAIVDGASPMNEEELMHWFDNVRNVLETAYTSHTEPWQQSGKSGPEESWVALRKPIADCVDRSGSFLDIGCANGYLLECVLRWTAQRGLEIDPYGLDFSACLLELAKKRLPQYAGHLYLGNAFDWEPPRKFDFVRTELVYVPGEYERQFIERLLDRFVASGGKLLVANYGEGDPNPERGLLPGCEPTRFLLERLVALDVPVDGYRDGYDPIKGRRVRIAIVTHIPHDRDHTRE
jgi:SAM-dependent methyltransferase